MVAGDPSRGDVLRDRDAGLPQQNTFRQVLELEIVIAVGVFVVILSALVVALIRRRASSGRPTGKRERPWLEGSFVVLLVGVAAVLAWVSISANDREHDAATPSMRVEVTAFQWCWRFSYPGSAVSIVGTCGPHGSIPTLVLPTGRPVEIEVTSSDVIHEFWVPDLRYKVEALPDHVNSFTVTLSSSGRWIGRCSEFCGVYHAYMDFYLQAVSPSAYQQWLQHHASATVT